MNATLPSKELAELQRRFKAGYTVEQTSGGHFTVLDPEGNKVMRASGTPLTLAGTPHGGRQTKNVEAELRRAGVLRETPSKAKEKTAVSPEARTRREAHREMNAVRQRNRAAEAKALLERMTPVVEPIGGLRQPGNQADIAHVAALLARKNGEPGLTPDLLALSLQRVRDMHWVEPRYQRTWTSFIERLEQAESIPTEYFALLREARNIPTPESLSPTQLQLPSDEWPFAVVLIEIEKLFLDHAYQRPPFWPFIRKVSAGFDETLVGAIDVSDRGGRYAIMDGQLRYEAMRLVGKTMCWCSVYSGLDQGGEARFFLKKNRDRKAIHSYYTYRARLIAADPAAVAIDKITRKFGYRIWMTSAGGIHDNRNISAILACEDAYSRSSEARKECLTPTLETLKAATFGRKSGQATTLIRGLGRFFQLYNHVDMERLAAQIATRSPDFLIGRAREEARGSGSAQMQAMVRVLVYEYNSTLKREERSMRLIAP